MQNTYNNNNDNTNKLDDGGILMFGYYFPKICDILLLMIGIFCLIVGHLLTIITLVSSRSINEGTHLSSSFIFGLVLIVLGCLILILALILYVFT